MRYLVPTCQRPETLRRALDLFVGSVHNRLGKKVLLVLDDSSDVDMQHLNKGLVDSVNSQHDIVLNYFGRSDFNKLNHLLPYSAISDALVFSSLVGSSDQFSAYPGRIRNVGLLLTTGTKVTSLDDDTLLHFLKMSNTYKGIFYEKSIPALLPLGDEKLINRYCSSVLPDALELFDSILSLPESAGSLKGPVKIAMTGIYGARWYSKPHAYLSVPSTRQKLTWPRRGDYEVAKRSPYALLLAPELLYTDSPFFVSACFGYDASEILPPFFPGIRASDALWGWMVRRMYPQSPICHLPIAIEHDRTLKRAFTDEDFKKIVPNSSEILLLLLNYISPDIPEIPPVNVLDSLGESLMRIRSLSLSKRRKLLSELYIQSLSRRLGEFRQRLEESGGRPRFWARDVREHIDLLRKEVATGEPWRPAEFRSDKDSRESKDEFGSYIGRCGELLCAWPEIWERAVGLKASGEFSL